MALTKTEAELLRIHERLRACRKCPNVCDRAVHGPAIASKVLVLGQAPGIHEGRLGRPFAYTAGKTLFKWLGQATGFDEKILRKRVYFSAVARCFPGKARGGKGDRPPSPQEIKNCSEHLAAEIQTLKPRLILAVGRSAIVEIFKDTIRPKSLTLEEVVGKKISVIFHGHKAEVISLPHPSGVSTWPHSESGKAKLARALRLIKKEFERG